MKSSMKSSHHSVRTYQGMNTSTEKVGPSKSSEQNVRKPRPGNNRTCDDDNELVKYMSNLPGFLQQMEKKTNIQEKALNFGVLDWKRLEKWKYTERLPGKYPPQKTPSSSKARIGQGSKKQPPPPHVRNTNSLYSGKQAVRFDSPQRQPPPSQRVMFFEEMNVYKNGNDPKNEMLSEKEGSQSEQVRRNFSLPSHNNNSNAKGETRETKFDDVKLTSEGNPSEPENIVLLKPENSKNECSQFTDSRSSLDEQLEEITGNRLSECSLTSSFLEMSDEKQAPKERASSPAPRLSLNLGRVSRSLSFKDNHSALPQLSPTYTSVKSGPARPEISPGTDNFKSDRANACGRARSSPLRRLLLDPLLKHRGAHAVETVSKGPSQGRKPEGPTALRALLQLTLKNGLPSFKLVANNSNEMLAAAVKRLPMTGESDSCVIYAFYSVLEIRKKNANWMSQGSKSKSCGLGYNIVGEMKISGSGERDVRECVLYGVDPGQVDKQTLEYVSNEEIAAVVVRNSSKVINDRELSEENKNSSGIVVILPGGVHGIPITGELSSLISRWRFGGSCDCGGWDVGCKLRILADDRKSNSLQASMSGSTFDHFNLFLEGGEGKNRPVFSLKPFSNGYYSIEFDASISLLEAFATCVAHVTCSRFPEITDGKSPLGPEHFPEAIVGTDKRRTPTTFQEQLPPYVTCPPLSPAGRI